MNGEMENKYLKFTKYFEKYKNKINHITNKHF